MTSESFTPYRLVMNIILQRVLLPLVCSPNESSTDECETAATAQEETDAIDHDQHHETEEVGDSIAALIICCTAVTTTVLELVVETKDPCTVGKHERVHGCIAKWVYIHTLKVCLHASPSNDDPDEKEE